jgi:hypothetical protein
VAFRRQVEDGESGVGQGQPGLRVGPGAGVIRAAVIQPLRHGTGAGLQFRLFLKIADEARYAAHESLGLVKGSEFSSGTMQKLCNAMVPNGLISPSGRVGNRLTAPFREFCQILSILSDAAGCPST